MGEEQKAKAAKWDIEKWLSHHALSILIGIFVFALLAVVIFVGLYIAYFHNQPISTSTGTWGQLGDYFGGTLNPVFGFLSVMALLAALAVQRKELKLSTDELAKSTAALDAQNRAIEQQRFEQTFFSWLNTYRELLGEVERVYKTDTRKGRRALYLWWAWELKDSQLLSDETFKNCSAATIHKMVSQIAMERWGKIYDKNEYQIDSLFRVLYRLILWVDSQDPNRLSPAQKWLYVSIIRAQLSWIEMVYLFYNGHTERGAKFKVLIEKYALFDNLTTESDEVLKIVKEFPPDGTGYAPTAYSSALARKALCLPEAAEEVLALATVISAA